MGSIFRSIDIARFCNIIEDFNAVKDALPHANKPYEKCGCINEK